MSCKSFVNTESGTQKIISGTTCGGITGSWYISYGQYWCLNVDEPFTICQGLQMSGTCIDPSPTPTPSITASNTPTPTPTGTFVPTPTQTETPTNTPTYTPTNTTTPTPTATLPCGDFVLSPSYTFNFTNVSGTGLPTFTLPTSGANETQCYYGSITAQTLSVTLTGTSMMIPKLAVTISVDGTLVDYACITSTASTVYNLTLPSTVYQPDEIRISVVSGYSPC